MPRIASGEALKDLPALSPPRLRKSEGAEDENEKQRAALSLQSFPLKDGPTSPTCAAGTDGEGWTRFTEGMASLIRLSWSTGAEQATAVEDGVAESGPNGDRYQAMMEGEMELKPLKSSEQQHSARSHPPPVAALACSPPHSPLANSPGALAGAIGPAAEGDDETSVQAGAAEDATEEEEEEGAGGAPLEGEERAPPSLPQTTPQLVILPTFSVWQPPSAPPSVEEEEDEEGEEEREEEREDGSGAAAPSSVGLRASFHPQTEPCGRTASTRSRSDGDAEDEKDMLGQGRVTAVARSAGRDPAAGTPAHQPEPEAQKGAGGGSEAVGPALSAAAWSWPWLGGAAAAAETGAPAAGERAWSSMSAAAAFALAPDSGDGEEPRRGWGRSFSLEQPAAGAAAAAAEARQLQRGASAGADASPSQQQAQSAPGSPKREPSWRIASSFPNIRMLWPSAPPAAAAGAAAPRPPPPAAASAALAALEGEREGAAAALGLDSDAAAAEGVQQVVTEEHLLHLGSLLGEAQAASVLAAVGAAPEAGHERSLLGVPDMPAAAFSALEWERIVQEVKPGFHYQAWRKPLRGGLYVYKTRMTVDGASAAELRAFHHHPSTRALVDHTMETYQLLPCPGRGEEETGFFFMTARFPRPMASRAYVSARRTWLRPADGGCYTVNLGARHPDAPRASGSIMVHDYLSAYVIRSGPAPEQGGDSAVLETLYFDNSGVRPGVVNFTIRMGLWKVVQPYEAAFRRHQAAATPPRPLPPPPQPVPAAAALQALLRAVPSHSGDARPEAAAAGKGVPGGIPLVARAGPVAAGPQRHRGGWRRLKPMVLLGIALKLASSRRPGCSRRHE